MIIRPAKASDAQQIRAINAPYVKETAIVFDNEVPTLDFFAHQIENTLKSYPYLVCEVDGVVKGYAYAHRLLQKAAYDWETELTIYIDKDCRHSGIGRKLYQALLYILKQQHVEDAYACITHPNEASETFHTSFGFKVVGRMPQSGYKLGRWHDVVWMHLALGEHQSPPPSFRPFSSININEITL